MIIRTFLKRIKCRLGYYLLPPLKYARLIGVEIGENNLIGKDHWPSEGFLVKIGNNCQLTNSKIFTHGGGNVVRQIDPTFDVFGKVVIGDYVYLGSNSLIMPGVTIGDHCLIAAGSVVTKSIPPGCVVAGNPARILCSIEEYYERNKEFNMATYGIAEKKKVIMEHPEKLITKTLMDKEVVSKKDL